MRKGEKTDHLSPFQVPSMNLTFQDERLDRKARITSTQGTKQLTANRNPCP
jgi:hypothetical protein